MSSKQSILKKLQAQRDDSVALPETFREGVIFDDPFARFQEMTKAVGGTVIRVRDTAEAAHAIGQLTVVREASRVYSAVPAVAKSDVDLTSIKDPRELDQLDLAIASGHFAVAENGAVWVTDQGLAQRSVLFIAEHLILIVSASELVHNMHQAYDRLSFSEAGYGLFISGPSKTADIEQSLVIGAQGPRTLHVLLLESE